MITFFALAYGLSWAMLLILYGLLGLPAALAILLQTLGPTLAALIMTGLLEGPTGPRRLLARVRIWRVARRWYLFALAGIPAVCVIAALVLPGAFVGLGDASAVKLGIEFLVFMLVGFFSGPLFEEPGWRGFALPHLQGQMGALRGTLVLGVLWAAWHLPQYLVPEWADENGGLDPTLVVTFLVMVVAITPIMTWVFNRTKGSLLLVMLAHASINASLAAFVVASSALDVGVLAFGALSVLLIVATRGRLGYAPSEDPA
jgi:membrane protease YdiL (CAAX protease family)